MSIQSFTLRNYRSFVERTTIELRPLTLLFGYNNTGKSALLRTLPLIADSLGGQSSTPLALDNPAVRESHFSELLSRISGRNEFEVELSLDNSKLRCLKWTIREIPELKTHVISRFSILHSDGVKVEARWTAKFSTRQKLSNRYDLQVDHKLFRDINIRFKGLLVSFIDGSEETTLKQDIKQRLLIHSEMDTRVQWLSAVRRPPLRINQFKGSAPDHLEPDGGGAEDILAYDNLTEKSILSKVSRWYEKHLKQRVVVVQREELFRIMLEPMRNSPYQINSVDVGEGLLQVLPVLVASAMVSEGNTDILAIEEPESHLHPRLHAALAEQFCELARQQNSPKVLLETHSENFLLRVQLELARGLDPKLVKIYWIHQPEDGEDRSVAELVTFDELGHPEGHKWPKNVFSDNIEQARQLIQARRKRSKL
jgi:predicted ATPase